MTSDEVCSKLNLNPVEMDYSEDDFRNLNSYRLFMHHVRPVVVRENPKIAMAKVVQLIAAMWKEFLNVNPYRDQIEKVSKKSKEGNVLQRSLLQHVCFQIIHQYLEI